MGVHSTGCSSTLLLLFFVILFYVSVVQAAVENNAFFIKSNTTFVIDGNADEWDSITTTHPILDQYDNTIALFKVAYNANSLYFYVTVVDASPLKNDGNRGDFQQLFYSGDALSICFGPYAGAGTNIRVVVAPINDGADNVIYIMRPSFPQDPSSHPYDFFTQAFGKYHVDYDWYVTDSGTAVALNKTSTGWAAEISLPWSVLLYTPTDGDYLPFDIEVLSSNPLGTAIVAANWWFSHGAPNSVVDIVGQAMLYPYLWGLALLSVTDVGPQVPAQPQTDPAFVSRGVPITFQVPESGVAVSVNIIDAETEWVIIDLVRAKIFNKGPATVYWNGRDREGKIVPGQTSYRARIAIFSPLDTKFAASIGNSGRPGWVTEDGLGSLGGIHYGSKYVTVANNVDAPEGSVTSDIIISGSSDEGIPGIRRINTTQYSQWVIPLGVFENSQGVATEDDTFCYASMNYPVGSPVIIQCFNSTTGIFLENLNTVTVAGAQKDVGLGNTTLTLCGGKLIYGDAISGTLRINQFVNGNWTEQVNIDVPNLVSTCRLDANTAVLVFATSVYLFDATTFKVASDPIIDGHQFLVACTADRNGNIYVSETGSVNQVFQYNSKGINTFTYGKPGGRSYRSVPYDPLVFANVSSLAVSPDGVLYLVERLTSPYRIAFINVATGEWIRDFYGPVGYTTNIIDLDDASNVYYFNPLVRTPSLMQLKINYTQFQSDPYHSEWGYNITAIHYLSQNGIDNTIAEQGGVDVLAMIRVSMGYGSGVVFVQNGFKYMYISPYYRVGAVFLLWDNDAEIWYPIAMITENNEGWADLNHNHLVEPEEMYKVFPPGIKVDFLFEHCDRNLNLYGPAELLKPSSIDSYGVPNYNNSVLISTVSDVYPLASYVPSPIQSYNTGSSPTEDFTGEYLSVNYGPCMNQGFWDRASDARVMRVENGTIQWAVGHRDYAQKESGDITILFNVAGEVDDVFLVSDVIQEYQAYTSDGLTLGWLLKDPTGVVPSYGYNSIDIENAGQGLFIKDPVSGKRLLFTITTGDFRILEVVGPFDENITRQIINIDLPSTLPRNPEDDSTYLTKKAYALDYTTMGDGSDGTFYGSRNPYYGDGYDFEWQSIVPSIMVFDKTTDPSSPNLIGELRLRRDAGQLAVFADIVDDQANFPFFPVNTSDFNVTNLFLAPSVEILIGPAPNNRTQPQAGDTRIILSAVYNQNFTWNGVALAIKPNANKVAATGEFRAQNNLGGYVGNPLPDGTTLDFSQLEVIPGATVAINPRLDKKGYRLEAYIPLALLSEITSVQPLLFRRSNVTGSETGTVWIWCNDTRSDFNALPFSFNVAVYKPGKTGAINRYPWIEDNFSGSDPAVMNPSLWGAIARQPLVNGMTLGDAGISEPLKYISTMTGFSGTYFTPPFGASYTPKVSTNGFFGGGWYAVNGKPTFVSSPVPIPGFSLEYISGASDLNAEASNPWWPSPNWDSSNLFFSYAPTEVLSELVEGNTTTMEATSMIIHLTTNFQPGVSGVLHVLYGQQGGDTYWDAWLNVTDIPSGITISGLDANYTDLRFPPGYHQDDTEAKISTFNIQGQSTISISITRNTPYKVKFAYITAIWVEMAPPSFYVSPAKVSVYTLGFGQDSPVQYISIFKGNQLIGTSSPGGVYNWENVQSGIYTVSVVATDLYQESEPTAFVVTVYGPAVLASYPSNSSIISSDSVQVALQIGTIGPNAVSEVTLNVTLADGSHFDYLLPSPPPGANYTSPSIPVTAGSVTYTVRAVDVVGAYTVQTYSFTVASSDYFVMQSNKKPKTSSKILIA